MKKLFSTLLWIGIFCTVHAQLNTTLVAQLDYDAELNDIWGWVAPNGTEYALVGLKNGVSIVSLANPANPQEVAFVPGAFSVWRDLKTWGNFAYITTDQSGTNEGLLVIDLSELPLKVTATNWRPMIDNNTLRTCHNLYIDENGIAYLAGCNVNAGGMLYVDVKTTPGTPVLIGKGPSIYAHDVYVQDNIMYASEIYDGKLGIYDISDKLNTKPLASQTTPFRFTHNAWTTENGDFVFTTDERANAPVAAYDISDLNDIREMDQFRPIYTLGTGTIPHNVHVKDNYLHISYYTAGGVIVDASRPENLVEVANWDSSLGPDGGFAGAWGMYPFLPSGNVLISDIENGLFIIKPNLKRACFLEGRITDSSNNQPLANAEIEILSNQVTLTNSSFSGNYKTGQAQAGTFDVLVERSGYESKTVQATLQNGVVTILDVALRPLASFTVGGKAVNSVSGASVANAKVIVSNDEYYFETTADFNGNFNLGNVYQGKYNVSVGAWGYLHKVVENFTIDNNKSITIPLDRGYQDDFFFDLGWTASSDSAVAGFWERGVPVGATFGGQVVTPTRDIDGDLGETCYLTGNQGDQAGFSDVDEGRVTLTSPLMDLSGYNNPIISYYLWFYNNGGNGNPDDSLVVRISNGIETITLEKITTSRNQWRDRSEFELRDYIEITDNMTVIFETADFPPNGHIVKAAVDAFLVQEGNTTPVEEPLANTPQMHAFPNPFSGQLNIHYKIIDTVTDGLLIVYNSLGQRVDQVILSGNDGNIIIGENLDPGIYFLQIQSGNKVSEALKVIKTN